MPSESVLRQIGGRVAGCFVGLAIVGSVMASEPQVSVSRLLKTTYRRVAGAGRGGAAVFPDSGSRWCSQAIGSPTVVFDGKTYRMWFVGMSRASDPRIPYGFHERIGLATSTDGVRWVIGNKGEPVLDYGPDGAFDDCGIAHPFVLRVNGQFMMWYGGIDGRAGKDIGDGPAHVRVEQVGLAVSRDGIKWIRANGGRPVMTVGKKGAIDSVQATGMHVIRRGRQFMMWYGAYNGKHTIGLATSPDGIVWTKQNGGRSLPGLAGPKQLGPSVYFDGSRYLMYYNTIVTVPTGGSLWTMFAATSGDGVHWASALGGRPVLGPAPPGNFGSADGKTGNNHSVHPTKLVVLGDRVRVWYGAEGHKPLPGWKYPPSAVGLMEAMTRRR